MADELLKAWLRQAHAGFRLDAAMAAQALGMLLLRGPSKDDGLFRHHFLHNHSPLTRLQAHVAANCALPRSLRHLVREINAELRSLDGNGLLRKVDATTPTLYPFEVSYRYPFRDATSGNDVAPADWTPTEWDAYQSDATGVAATIERFLKVVENRQRRDARGAP